jgi:hypothetical protein
MNKKMLDLQKFGNIPLSYAALEEMLCNYKSPYDKVSAMEKRGEIVRLKKGLYVVSDKISRKPLSRKLIANHLYGPSYVSFETALAFYDLIPEKVYTVCSATFEWAKQFENSVGRFEYITVPQDYYPVGINQQTIDEKYTYLFAAPEKALCYLILATPNLRLQSIRAMREYLEDDFAN